MLQMLQATATRLDVGRPPPCCSERQLVGSEALGCRTLACDVSFLPRRVSLMLQMLLARMGKGRHFAFFLILTSP
jgi:hypothetical protein